MTAEPTVSVIMPARNEASTIGEQLAALARQEDLLPTEIIVADNGSTDGTLEVVRSFTDQLPQLRWIVASEASGPSHARNAAAKVAVGEVLAFCDSDDQVRERWLVHLVAGLRDADLVGGPLDVTRINDADVLAWRDVDQRDRAEEAVFLPTVVTSNMAIRADVFRAVGMFDESFVWAHDQEFSYRVQLAGYRCAHVPDAVVDYRIKPSVRALCRREFQDSVGMVHVFAVYRARGMPCRRWTAALRIWAWLVVHLPDLLRRRTRGRWLRKAAGSAGRVVGSVRYRVLCL